MNKILIVDDHPTVRFATRLLLEREGYEVLGEAHDGVNAVAMCQELLPEVVILDLGLPRLDGLTVLERLRALNPSPRIMVFTGLPPRLFAKRCIEAGASAFVVKEDSLDILRAALKAVLSGYSYLPDSGHVLDASGSELERLDRLSNREIAVLALLIKGASNTHIAESMLLSAKTVSTYKARIMEKLQVDSLVEMVELANRHKLS